MTIDKSIYNVLYDEGYTALEGRVFTVFPGEIAVIQGFGFMDYKSRMDNSTLLVPQVACLEMILFKENKLPDYINCFTNPVDFSTIKGEVLAIENVRMNGCDVKLSRCDNVIMINVPGTYRFFMDDPTTMGNVRIYMRTMSKDEYIWNSKLFIGA